MKYLLDTCIVSYFFRAVPNVLAHLEKTKPDDLAISCITYMEIEFGLALNIARASILKAKWDQFCSMIHILPFKNEDAIIAATIRAKLQKAGRPIGYYDVLIAATAIRHQLICVTNNVREFDRIVDLKLENWFEEITA